MKLFLDTEFNGFQGRLLSLALVDEAGHSFYVVIYPGADFEPDPWVAEHVLPVLNRKPMGEALARKDLERWLAVYESIHVIADWPEDIAHFCSFLITGPGMRIDTPPLTLEVRRDIDTSGSHQLHNALADAHALRLAYLTKD